MSRLDLLRGIWADVREQYGRAPTPDDVKNHPSMAQLKLLSPLHDEQLDQLAEEIAILANETRYKSGELLDAAEILLKLGYDVGEIITMLRPLAEFAERHLLDVDQAARDVGWSLSIFDLDAGETERLTDPIDAAVKKHFAEPEEIFTALGIAGPAGHHAGYSIETIVDDIADKSSYILSDGESAGKQYREQYTEEADARPSDGDDRE